MKPNIAPTLKNYNFKNLPKDLLAGIIIMAVSIPISMGYAQIAGLPAVYGLYGSVFPIILFALLSTSPQFIPARAITHPANWIRPWTAPQMPLHRLTEIWLWAPR